MNLTCGLLVIHICLYWFNKWRKTKTKKTNDVLEGMTIPMALVVIGMHKKNRQLEEENNRLIELLGEIYASTIVDELENDSSDETLKIKKRYIVKR